MPTKTAEITVLIVDDQELVRNVCRDVVSALDYHPMVAASGMEALRILEQHPVDIVVSDLKMPNLGGLELLEKIKASNPRVEVVIMTGYASIDSAVRAIKLGAFDYIVKPFSPEELNVVLRRLVETMGLKDENNLLRERLRSSHGLGRLIGQSPQIQQVFKVIQRVAASRVPVLITGESGTGKELVARSIHDHSPWHNKPFVPVDCASLVPTLIESELFGYVRGAFTGATHSKDGLLHSAGDGTLFFDEIAELPVELQTRLLRVIQEKEFRPVGGTHRIPFHARIISATNRNLQVDVEQGSFRRDLYFRLNVVTIVLPPLRERRVDIPLLAEHILVRLARSNNSHRRARWVLSSDTLDRMIAYDWPGNVRELENCLERAMTLGSGPLIQAADLPSSLQHPARCAEASAPESVIPLEVMERQAIHRALTTAGGDKVLASRLLGIGKTTLYRKLREYELKK